MARHFISLLAAALAGAAIGQPFGRFGYVQLPDVPGFAVSLTGFKTDHAAADALRWHEPLPWLRVAELNDVRAAYKSPRRVYQPQQVTVNLLSPGFECEFPLGVGLRTGSLAAPYLSNATGSYGAGIETPPSNWILVSFQDKQPPILLVFLGRPVSLTVTGSSGDWRIASSGIEPVRVRVCLPFGTYGHAANSAAALGDLVSQIVETAALWSAPTPSATGYEVRREGGDLIAVWRFDRPGALLPFPVGLARAGGYRMRLITGARPTNADLPEGPQIFSTESKIAIAFPAQVLPSGRAVVLGEVGESGIAADSPFDSAAVAQLALLNLMSYRDTASLAQSRSLRDQFLSEMPQIRERWSLALLPFHPEGDGTAAVAAQALLAQAMHRAAGAPDAADALLLSLAWKRDWATWGFRCGAEGDRAAAYAALACSLSSNPERQVQGAMYHAGIAYRLALKIFRDRRGFAPLDPPDSALLAVRNALFGRTGEIPAGAEFVRALQSPLRIFGPRAIIAEPVESGVRLRWQAADGAPFEFALESKTSFALEPGRNCKSLESNAQNGRTQVAIVPAGPGACEAIVRFDGEVEIPLAVQPPSLRSAL